MSGFVAESGNKPGSVLGLPGTGHSGGRVPPGVGPGYHFNLLIMASRASAIIKRIFVLSFTRVEFPYMS